MPSFRVYNRYTYAEILGGLIGWPLAGVALLALWLFGNPTVANIGIVKGVAVAVCSIAAPFYIAYKFYRAVWVAAMWIKFGESIIIRRWFWEEQYPTDAIGGIFIDKQAIGMSSGVPLVNITVANEKYLRLTDREGRDLARIGIDRASCAKLLEFLRKHPYHEIG